MIIKKFNFMEHLDDYSVGASLMVFGTKPDGTEGHLQKPLIPNIEVTHNNKTFSVAIWNIFPEISSYKKISNALKTYPKLIHYFDVDVIKAHEKFRNAEIEKRFVAVTLKHSQLLEACEAVGSKADIANLKAIDELLLCEAEPLLNKLENRIYKKANAKNILIAKKLSELREETQMECV